MIAVDWGTSSLRVYRLDASGALLEQRDASIGLLACQGAFEATLAAHIDGWDDPTVVMAGMVGSRNGWCEVPYVSAPAGIVEIGAALQSVEAPSMPLRRVFIVPGVAHRPAEGSPEVMRGEETQVLGLIPELPAVGTQTICLPGTHSKWVQVTAGRIETLRTAMTGELYALLRRHSLLAALMPRSEDEDSDDRDTFVRGVVDSSRAGGLLNHLFGVRTLGLIGSLKPRQAASYLSGLLIGSELRGLVPPQATEVHLVGRLALVQRYGAALEVLQLHARAHAESATACGLWLLARARSLPL